MKKIDGSKTNPIKSSSIKVGEHIPCRYSLSTNNRNYIEKAKIGYVCDEKLTEKKMLMTKHLVNLKVIVVIIQVNKEALHIACAVS